MRFQLPCFQQHCPWIIVLFFLLSFPTQGRGGLVFQVSANTTTIEGLTGSFDMQFNGGGIGMLPATATITNFSTDGTGLSLNTTDGDVSGTLLPGPLVINNTMVLNDVLENITFGTSISFTLTLSGPGVTSPDPNLPGSGFGLSLYDANFNPLLTTDPAGTVVTMNLNPDGSTGVETFPSDNSGGTPVGSAVPQATAVPEPSTGFLIMTALPFVVVVWRGKKGT